MWRVENGLQIGIGPEKKSVDKNGQSTYYGNMILEGESNGNNFFYPQTFEHAKKRVKEKKKMKQLITTGYSTTSCRACPWRSICFTH